MECDWPQIHIYMNYEVLMRHLRPKFLGFGNYDHVMEQMGLSFLGIPTDYYNYIRTLIHVIAFLMTIQWNIRGSFFQVHTNDD
jgi:hypothetical protein